MTMNKYMDRKAHISAYSVNNNIHLRQQWCHNGAVKSVAASTLGVTGNMVF